MGDKDTLKNILIAGSIIILISAGLFYFGYFNAPKNTAALERFIVPLGFNDTQSEEKLQKEGFVKSAWAFNFALNLKKFGTKIDPGAYKISKSMNVWRVAEIISSDPYMKWVVIPEGLRKEEIANILAINLGWSDEVKKNWIEKNTTGDLDFIEGVYFPDTYLIPKDESPEDVAKRLRLKFEEKFIPYSKEAIKQNIKWTTVVKMASIIQREAGSKDDMPLISGILWNRLNKKMRLDVDCSLQYARGDKGNGWWAPISLEDKKIESPFNLYVNKGLPPNPISNPGLDALKSVLYPEKTSCLFYLHDNSKAIHCAKTYEEHLQNIDKYLK